MLSVFLKTFVFVLILGCSVGFPFFSKKEQPEKFKLKVGDNCYLKKTRKAGFLKRISGYTPHEYYFKQVCPHENWRRHVDKVNPFKKDRLTFQLISGEQQGLFSGDKHLTVEIVRKAMLVFSQSPLKLGVELVNSKEFDQEADQQTPVYRLVASDLPLEKPIFYDENKKSFYVEIVQPISEDDKYDADFDAEEEEDDDDDVEEVKIEPSGKSESRRLLLGKKKVNLVKAQLLLLTKNQLSNMKLKKNKNTVMFRIAAKKTKVSKNKQFIFEPATVKKTVEEQQILPKNEKYTAAFFKALTGEAKTTFKEMVKGDAQAAKKIFGVIDENKDLKLSAKEFKTKAMESFTKELSKEKVATLRDVFADFDENHDGALDLNEFNEFIETLIKHLSEEAKE